MKAPKDNKYHLSSKLIASIGFLLIFINTHNSFAEKVSFSKDYTYQMGLLDDKVSSRTIAYAHVREHLFDELSSYMISDTMVKSYQFSSSQICALLAGFVPVEITNEKSDGLSYYLQIRVNLEPMEIVKYIKRMRADKQRVQDWEVYWGKASEALKSIQSFNQNTGSHAEFQRLANILRAVDSFYRGIILLEEYKNEAAIEAFNVTIDRDSENTWAYSGRGWAYHRLSMPEKALVDINKAIELNPHFVDAYIRRAKIYRKTKKYAEAIKSYDKAIELDPKNAKAYNGRGWISFFYMENKTEGLLDLERACEIAPTFIYIKNLGIAHMYDGNYPKAINFMNKVVELRPKDEWSYIQRGRVYVRSGNYEQALKDFDKAVEINPLNNKGHQFLVTVYMKMNDIQYDTLVRAMQANPKSDDDYLARGLFYLSTGNYQLAIADFDAVCRINPKKTKAYLYRASTHGALKNPDDKIEDLKNAARLGSNAARDILNSTGIMW